MARLQLLEITSRTDIFCSPPIVLKCKNSSLELIWKIVEKSLGKKVRNVAMLLMKKVP